MLENLFSPGKIGTMETKNRIVFTPMGNYLANPDGSVSDKDIAFYGERAKGGVGVVFTACYLIKFVLILVILKMKISYYLMRHSVFN